MARAKREQAKETKTGKVERHTCTLPRVPDRILPPTLNPNRARLIRMNEKKWANGTRLRYFFFDRRTDGPRGGWVGPEAQQNAVREAFDAWKELGIGLEFEEVPDREDAEIRIGFLQGDGAWSYVGRDVVDVARDPNERTMNFGWDLTTAYGRDTALHEIGHTLGFPHEHQNPYAGIEWNEPAVYDYFGGPPNNWDDETIRWNILRKIPPGEASGSEWDPDSIMHYTFPAGVIEQPAEYRNGLTPEPGLSEKDVEWARQFYPALEQQEEAELRAYESQRLAIQPGEQVNFRIRPQFTRRYRIQTFGAADTMLALFENVNGAPRFVAGDDDSGADRNARLRERLYRGGDYVLRIRLYYSHLAGETAVFMW